MSDKIKMKLMCAGATFSNMCDRFVSEGYKNDIKIPSFEERLEMFAKIGGMSAIGYGWYLGEEPEDPIKYKDLLAKYGMRVGSCGPDNYTKAHWKYGTFAARDPQVRREIVEIGKAHMDWAEAANAVDIMFWMAHDGYNYPFQDDYMTHWEYMAECIAEIAGHNPNVKCTLEYKNYEPLTPQYASDVSKVILLCQKVNQMTGYDNCKMIVDYGHALFGNENPAESVALANHYNLLSMIHLNDNMGRFDDDLIFGTVSFWQGLEFFWKLLQIGYVNEDINSNEGWFIMDNWPARMDGIEATTEFVRMANHMMNLAASLPHDKIKELQKRDGNPPHIYKILRECVLKEV